MENFEGNPQRLKEKSVYLLHLDVPRIIIISSVVIGVIIVSFLFGMNFVKQGEVSEAAIANDNILFDNGGSNLFDRSIPAPPDETASKPMEENIANLDKSNVLDRDDAITDNIKKESVDILTNENIKQIVPPVKEKNIKIAKKPVSEKSTSVRKKKSKKKKAVAKKKKKTRKKRSNVVEVATGDNIRSVSSPYYAIQIVSYDRKSKAQREMKKLRDLKYDAYISRKNVNGKTYYRVRVGPISSKRKALNLLGNIQDNSRYFESYMIRE